MKYPPLSPDQMVRVKSIAPFELADIIEAWSQRCAEEARARRLPVSFESMFDPARLDMCGGLGPPWPVTSESHKEFGLRAATAIIYLLKEV